MHRRRRVTLLVLTLPALTATGCTDSSGNAGATTRPRTPTSDRTIATQLTEYKISLSAHTAPAGPVTFAVSNDGAIPHELVLVRTRKPADALLRNGKADITGAVGHLPAARLGVNEHAELTVDLPRGHYALVCNLPGHYEGGMHTDFTVR